MGSSVGGRGGGGGVRTLRTGSGDGTGQALVEMVRSGELRFSFSGKTPSDEAPNGSERSASCSSVLLYTVLEDLFDCDDLGASGAGTRLTVECL